MLLSTEISSESFVVNDPEFFKQQAFEWCSQFEVCCYLDHNGYQGYGPARFDLLLAAGVDDELILSNEQGAFESLKQFYDQQRGWLFGYLSYDLKNDIENLSSNNVDGLGFPLLHFFSPLYTIRMKGEEVVIQSKADSPFLVLQSILHIKPSKHANKNNAIKHEFSARTPKKEYIETVAAIRQHIRKGDIYEMNFCQEFFQEGALLNEKDTFWRLNQVAKAPFSSYYKLKNYHLLCSSPERFLKKHGWKLISQPIKGTTKRGTTPNEDQKMRHRLCTSAKDRSENVMIVDLVRNDLSKSCIAGTVKVEELFGLKTFTQVHHLVSTVTGELQENIHIVDAIKNAFPMGSMTGAPKVRSMELIEEFEQTKRGLYSGAVGYFSPDGDFDFNVVIRSILYNQHKQYISLQVGGAIVYDSDPLSEYEECLLKAKGMFSVLGIL